MQFWKRCSFAGQIQNHSSRAAGESGVFTSKISLFAMNRGLPSNQSSKSFVEWIEFKPRSSMGVR